MCLWNYKSRLACRYTTLLEYFLAKLRLDPSVSFILEANNIEKLSQHNALSLKSSRLDSVTMKLKSSASIIETLTGSFCNKIVGNFPAKCTTKYHKSWVNT